MDPGVQSPGCNGLTALAQSQVTPSLGTNTRDTVQGGASDGVEYNITFLTSRVMQYSIVSQPGVVLDIRESAFLASGPWSPEPSFQFTNSSSLF